MGVAHVPVCSVIIPAHNEGSRIEPTLREYAAVFQAGEVIVVLNGCTDRTLDVVEALCMEFANVRYILIEEAVGKGGAVRAGFTNARSPILAYVDADGSTPAIELRRLVGLISSKYDAVIASRWLPGSTVHIAQPLLRRIVSRIFNLCTRILFGLPFADTQCGAKVFTRRAYEQVADFVETSNLAFDVDILVALRSAKFRILECPTIWNDRLGSRVRVMSASAQMLAAIVRLRLRHSVFHYVLPLFDHIWPTNPIKKRAGLNILFLNWRDVEHPQAGGAEVYIHEIARRLVQRGHRVTLMTAGFPRCSEHAEIDGVNIRRVGNKFTVYFLLPLLYIREYRNRFDVVVDAENGIPFYSPLFSLKPKLLLMFHVHKSVFKNHLPSWISWFFIWAETWLMPRVYSNDRIVTISEDTKREILDNRLTTHAVDVVHSGVGNELRPGTKADQPTILSLGRLKRYKRVDTVLRSFARISPIVSDARLIVAGTGDDESRLRGLAAELGIADKVSFVGFVDEAVKSRLLQRAWIFASASEMEGWGIAVLEANAAGTPAVVTNSPGLREAVTHSESGLVCRTDDEFADALMSVLTDAELRRRLSDGAIERAAGFTWEVAADRMLATITSRIGRFRFIARVDEEDWRLLDSSVDARIVGTRGGYLSESNVC